MDRFLAEHQTDGSTDSSGTFTLNRELARSKLQVNQLANPARFLLKLVQAAILARAPELFLTFKREVLSLKFSAPEECGLGAEPVHRGLDSLTLLPPSALRHLAVGLNTALGTECHHLSWGSPEGTLHYDGGSMELDRSRCTPEYAFEMVRKRPFWNFHMAFADEYHTLTTRCQFSPIKIIVDGSELQCTLRTEQVFAPAKPVSLSKNDYLYSAIKPGHGLRLAGLDGAYRQFDSDPQLHVWSGKPGTKHALLHRQNPDSLTGEAYLALYSQGLPGNLIIPVINGVTLDPIDDLLEYDGAVLVVDATGLKTDLSEFALSEGDLFEQRLEEWNDWVRSTLLSIPEAALTRAFKQNGVAPTVAPYRAAEVRRWLSGHPEDSVEKAWPAACIDTLGVSPLEGEEILFSLPALRRFTLSVHFDCRAILTTHRVIFWNPFDEKYSWQLTWDEVARSEIKDVYDSDLYFSRKGERPLEMALADGESRRKMRQQLQLLAQSSDKDHSS